MSGTYWYKNCINFQRNPFTNVFIWLKVGYKIFFHFLYSSYNTYNCPSIEATAYGGHKLYNFRSRTTQKNNKQKIFFSSMYYVEITTPH